MVYFWGIGCFGMGFGVVLVGFWSCFGMGFGVVLVWVLGLLAGLGWNLFFELENKKWKIENINKE